MRLTPCLDLSALVTCHTLYILFTSWQSAMFLLNSRMGPFTAPPGITLKDPFSRSYGAILPSSLTRFLSRALVYLYPPTCVGFGTAGMSVSQYFSRKQGHMNLIGANPKLNPYVTRMYKRYSITSLHCPSPILRLNPSYQCRNINLLSIDYAFRPRLRCRLTPGGRTCPGKPWDSGDQNFHLVFRYSCPHNH